MNSLKSSLILLLLLLALVCPAAAWAQETDAETPHSLLDPSGASWFPKLAAAEASEQGALDAGYPYAAPTCTPTGWYATPPSTTNFSWNPASPSLAGMQGYTADENCGGFGITYAVSGATEYTCGPGYRFTGTNGSYCATGWYLGGARNPVPKGGCNCANGRATSGDPIEVGTGNMSLRETDFESTDKRLQFSRFYNSTAANNANLSSTGIGWLNSIDAHIVDIEALEYPPTPTGNNNNNSPVYSDPSDACTLGFAALQAADPVIYEGITVKYVPPPLGVGAGSCQEFNQYGVAFGFLPILNTAQNYLLPSAPVLVQVGVGAIRDDGSEYMFYCAQGTCGSPSTPPIQLSIDASGYYTLIDADGVTERYDTYGMLLTRTWKDGYQLTLTHNGNGITGGDGTLQTLSDNHGRAIALTYDTYGKLLTVTTPDGQVISYAHDPHGRLTAVIYPTGTRTYQYTNTSFPNALTGIVDEDSATNGGNPYITWTYDSSDRANGDAGAGGVNQFSMTYNSDGSAVVTDPFGLQRTYTYQDYFGVPAVASISGGACATCGAGPTNSYDIHGDLSQSTDWNGNVTLYSILNGLLYQRVDGSGSTVQRTTNMTWDPVMRNELSATVLNTSVTPAITVAQTNWYYISGFPEPLAQCQQDPSVPAAMSYSCSNTPGAVPAGVRRWIYTYTTTPWSGLLQTVTDPDNNLTTYTYYTSNASGCPTTCPYRIGDLYTVKNASSQITTTFLSYDGAGRPLTMTDANGVETVLTWSSRGWLQSRAILGPGNSTTGEHVTSYGYDNTGQLTGVTYPDGSSLAMTYAAAHRLTNIADNLGNALHYTLNAWSNSVEDDSKDPSGTIRRKLYRKYNSQDQLQYTYNANVAVNGTRTYDNNGNLHLYTDGRGYINEADYDPLNRLAHSEGDTATIQSNINYTYDALDHVTNVEDPFRLNTTYTYDGLNDLTGITSPDTGSATSTYDAAGNLTTRIDARGAAGTATYSYDALNRLTHITYPTTSLNVTLTYDTTQSICNATTQVFSVGRLTKIADGSGTTQYCYDRFGNVAYKAQVIGGVTFDTAYSYDNANRIASITTPQNTLISYTRDGIGRITGVSYKLSGQTSATTVVSGVTYYPYGPIATITYGNGHVLTRTYDEDYVVSSINDPGTNGLSLTFGRDIMGNLTEEQIGSSSSTVGNTLTYDGLNRLNNVYDLNSTPIAAYTYDSTGNRLTKQIGSATPVYYVYQTNTHQLLSVGTTGGIVRSYDPMGNTTAIDTSSVQGFAYDSTGRMNQFSLGGTEQMGYGFNALGQRVEKLPTGNTAANQYTVYDESGHLIGDYNYASAITPVREMIWMDGAPVGVLNGSTGALNYIEPDQIGTPRVAINTSNAAVWTWSPLNDPFGETQPSGTLTLNNRFPGQVYDAESGLNYNYFRDYDSGTGRAIESDPLGLGGGISTYTYAYANPLSFSDPLGLVPGQVFTDPDCAALDMLQYLKDNSTGMGPKFQSGIEYNNDIVTVPGGYTYNDTFIPGSGYTGSSGSAPPNYYAHFHNHTLIPWDPGDGNLDFSRPGDVSDNPLVGDLDANHRNAYGPQYMGALEFNGQHNPNGSRKGDPVVMFNNGKSMKSSKVDCGKCKAH